MQNRLHFLLPGSFNYSGIYRKYLDFTLDKQLLNRETWADFVRVFRSDSDDNDKGWRCEYWGKMMRGASLVYRATGSPELYDILRDTVKDLLDCVRPDGRLSTYSSPAQLQGWDLWGRKYVMTGLMHFLEVSADKTLNERILATLVRHADCIIETVGPGKVNITETSDFWGGVNSCSILETFMALYNLTGHKRYLDFAEYIVETGGCRDGNLIKLAIENKIPPFKYPEVKAYETISFFEGVLAYSVVTGKEEYYRAVLNFFDAVADTDLTIIGCCGCTHELFDNSSVKQTEFTGKEMQETCVSVTWMRFCAKLLLLTGDSKYYDYIERTGYNAMYGSVNLYSLPMYVREKKAFLPGLPFDSYSPLVNAGRGLGMGGFKEFSFGGFYGCCACIASAGMALLPLTAVMQSDEGIFVNGFFEGVVKVNDSRGREIILKAESDYPREGRMKLTLESDCDSFELNLMVHAPNDLRDIRILVNDSILDSGAYKNPEGTDFAPRGYININKVFKNGDTLEICGNIPLIVEKISDSVAYRYGAVVLARDENSEKNPARFFDECPGYRLLEPCEDEMIRMEVSRGNGYPPMVLADYASCGKHWNLEKNKVTVWMKRA